MPLSSLPSIDSLIDQLEECGITLPPGPVHADGYGDSAALSESLLELIRTGRKRAGTGLLWAYEHDAEHIAKAGDIEIVVDHLHRPAVVTRIVSSEIVPFNEVTAEYAAIEGEGDGSLEYWRKAHWAFFSRECERIGREPIESMPVICSVFEVLDVVPSQSVGRLGMTPIRTSRLMLEPQVAAHAEEMFVVLSDPAIYEHENEPPTSVEWLRERFRKLESRSSPDGSEQWLNWVIRLPSSGLAGYVQATVKPDATAAIAYEFNSRYWGRGLAAEAVGAMIEELVVRYRVAGLSAVLKTTNRRSLRILERLGFAPASEQQHERANVEAGELLMMRKAPVHAADLP